MQVSFSRPKGVPVLTCTRPDGTMTWSKSRHGEFFGPHDLMHFAVESTLALRGSFFGLIASGWSIADFELPGAAARLPAEAVQTEHMVGALQQEQAFADVLTASAFNATIAMSTTSTARQVTDEELRAIRSRYAELIAAYRALKDGRSLELEW